MNSSSLEKERMRLLKEAGKHKSELEDEVKILSEKTERFLTTALIVGGSLALTYFLVRQFSSGKGKKSKKKVKKTQERSKEADQSVDDDTAPGFTENILSSIGETLVNEATAILLSIAKEKLIEYLSTQHEKRNEHSSKDN